MLPFSHAPIHSSSRHWSQVCILLRCLLSNYLECSNQKGMKYIRRIFGHDLLAQKICLTLSGWTKVLKLLGVKGELFILSLFDSVLSQFQISWIQNERVHMYNFEELFFLFCTHHEFVYTFQRQGSSAQILPESQFRICIIVIRLRNGKQQWEFSGERHLSRSPVKEFSVKDMERSGFGEKESVPGDRVEDKRRFSDWTLYMLQNTLRSSNSASNNAFYMFPEQSFLFLLFKQSSIEPSFPSPSTWCFDPSYLYLAYLLDLPTTTTMPSELWLLIARVRCLLILLLLQLLIPHLYPIPRQTSNVLRQGCLVIPMYISELSS